MVGGHISPPAATLPVGDRASLTASGDYLSGKWAIFFGPFPGAWTSSATSVATVSDQGQVTAVAQGAATITFTDPVSGFVGSAVITVK